MPIILNFNNKSVNRSNTLLIQINQKYSWKTSCKDEKSCKVLV